MKKLSHYDEGGAARMVDVSEKSASKRTARASAFVRMKGSVLNALSSNPKGDPLEVARIAGIMAAKRTHELIPMCHPLPISHVDIDLSTKRDGIIIKSSVTTTAQTGVEMEALTAVSVAALTIYDMTKALDKSMTIESVQLVEKTGGKSGVFRRK